MTCYPVKYIVTAKAGRYNAKKRRRPDPGDPACPGLSNAASAADGVRTMENLLKGIGGASAPTKPLFAATVHWTDGDQSETMPSR